MKEDMTTISETDTASSPAEPAKGKSPSAKFSLIFPVVCTLMGVAISSGANWLTGYQSTNVTQRTACILRIDDREKLLRSKAEIFLAAMGDFMNYTTFPRTNTVEELSQSAGPLMKAGFVVAAYAPSGLAVQSLKVSDSVRQGALASMHQGDKNAALATIQDSFGRWPSAYYSALGELDQERIQCDK